MDRGVKIVVACGLLGAGIAGAMLFRHPSPSAVPPRLETPDGLVLRQETDAQVAPPPATDRLTARIGRSAPVAPRSERSTRSTSDSSPTRPGEPPPPPSMGKSYPPLLESIVPFDDPLLGADSLQSEGADGRRRTHNIVDGDTLANLAERYLGDAAHSLEIYEANRELLPSPGVLPIGVEIRIPSRETEIPAPRNGLHEPGLGPVDPSVPPLVNGSM